MFTQTTTLDNTLDKHIKSLGLFSISSYKLWCKRNGFLPELGKSQVDLEAELEHLQVESEPDDPRIHKNHSPRTAEYIQRISRGEFDGQPLSSMMSWIRKLFDQVDHVEGAHDALLRLLLHVEKYADLLHSKQMFKRLGNSPRNLVISGLSQLALHHDRWIRPVEDWLPEDKKSTEQFLALADYLFVQYEASRCLYNAWFEPNQEEREIQQDWFLHVASGNNIRTAENLPFPVTKRTAHIFMTSRDRQPPLLSLRRAQIEAIGGGDKRHDWALTGNEYIHGRENTDFWTSIIHFFLNNPMLERSYVSPIIDYIHHQKFVSRRIPQPDGSVVETPPAQPNFCIKARSIDRLVREVDEWHASLTGEENEKVKEWDGSGIGDFALEEENKELHCGIRWTIQELCTSSLLYVEGRVMHHCVGSYTRKCVEGETCVFSIRAQPIPKDSKPDDEEPQQTHVLTVAIDNKKRQITQARGKFNLQPNGKISKAKNRKTDGPYQVLLRESARIMALWRAREGLAYRQE